MKGPNRPGLVGTVLLILLLFLDAFVDLLTMNSNVLGRIHSDSDLVPFYTEHSNGDVITDHEGFSNSARKYQHFLNLLLSFVPVKVLPLLVILVMLTGVVVTPVPA